jgi:hypothetical protein
LASVIALVLSLRAERSNRINWYGVEDIGIASFLAMTVCKLLVGVEDIGIASLRRNDN